jgi:dipeptidyl aminopeptidase/acylaminoacyl peptidase
MNKKKIIAIFSILLLAGAVILYKFQNRTITQVVREVSEEIGISENLGGPEPKPHPLSIEALRLGEYPGSEMVIEQTLSPGSNYQRLIASYKSEGLKIFGLLTIPSGVSPQGGFPAIIFNHGYISPSVYKTTEKYVAYQNAFARSGYVTFKSDFRGHGNSEGIPTGGYGSNGYTIDVLNAISSVQNMKDPSMDSTNSPQAGSGRMVNPNRIGMWGHSMGGHITLEIMVVNKDVKAGVIWAGVVGSYEDLFERWRRRRGPTPTPNPMSQRGRWRRELAEQFGDPSQNAEFWRSLSATSYLDDISGPVQLHHGTQDSSVPVEFSRSLNELLIDADKEVELFEYQGDDHNISANLSLALRRSVEFFDKFLK